MFPPGFNPAMRPPMSMDVPPPSAAASITPATMPLPTPILVDTNFAAVSRLPESLQRPERLAEFFLPIRLTPDSIKMIFGPDGFPHGLAYIKFANREECRRAVQRDGELGVKIRPCSREESSDAFPPTMQQQQPQPQGPSPLNQGPPTPLNQVAFQPPPSFNPIQPRYLLELSNLPVRAEERDLRKWLGNLNPIFMRQARTPDGRLSDRWFIEFATLNEGEACASRAGSNFQGRSVQCIKTNPEHMNQVFSQEGPPVPHSRSGPGSDGGRGDRHDRDRDRRPRSSSRDRSDRHSRDSSSSRRNRRDRTPPREGSGIVYMSGLPPNTSPMDILKFLESVSVANNGIHLMKGFPGTAYVQLMSPFDTDKALRFDGNLMRGNKVAVKPSTMIALEGAMKRNSDHQQQGKGMGPRNMDRPGPNMEHRRPAQDWNGPVHPPDPPEPSRQLIDPAVLGSIGPPGCVIALRNLPPNVSLEDLCGFFSGFQVKDDSVRMHYNDAGEPTGDCLLSLSHREDAIAAVRKLNGTLLRSHRVALHIPSS